MALFTKRPMPTTCYRKFSFKFGKTRIAIRPRRASRSDGWSLSPDVALSTGCAGARLILVRGSAMKNESCKSRKLRVATRLKHSF